MELTCEKKNLIVGKSNDWSQDLTSLINFATVPKLESSILLILYAESKFSGAVKQITAKITLHYDCLKLSKEYRGGKIPQLKVLSHYYEAFKRYCDVMALIIKKESAIHSDTLMLDSLNNLNVQLKAFTAQVKTVIDRKKLPPVAYKKLDENEINKKTTAFMEESNLDYPTATRGHNKLCVQNYALLADLNLFFSQFELQTTFLQQHIVQR